MKRTLLSLIVAAQVFAVVSINAENKIVANDITVQPGDTFDLEVIMTTEFDKCCGFQFDLTLPQGFAFAVEDGEVVYTLGSCIPTKKMDDYSDFNESGDDTFTAIIASRDPVNKYISGTVNQIMTITIVADESVEPGEYSFNFGRVYFSEWEANGETISQGDGNAIYVTKVTVEGEENTTGIESLQQINETPTATKIFRNGRIYILHDGNIYTICGQRVNSIDL